MILQRTVIHQYKKWSTEKKSRITDAILKTQGGKCSRCGNYLVTISDIKLAIGWEDEQNYGFLYSEMDEFRRVLATLDHKQPISKGGRNNLDNFQVLCFPCNCSKGSR